ncbi:MAG: biliverdin-producing heme oxygenase [Bacteroidales bacterium]|nr:biliverdin-producing heme oxygenase [Bacteroidales bacterium]MBK8881198.1 biliverdin-producing heme oxygenase [Bacteroidales bacterium]
MLPLKEATGIKHKQAERMPFNTRMFKGLLNKNEYLLYLSQQLKIFQTVESIGLPHSSLKRAQNVQADIRELKSQGYNSDLILNSTSAYADYLASLSYEQLLPHVYLNYMAIMFGGQMMKNAVPSAGRMYDFDNMQEAILAIRNVQKDEWADEVNKGFDFNILILEELETECNNIQFKSTV